MNSFFKFLVVFGAMTTSAAAATLGTPQHIAVGPNGYLYVADAKNGQVAVFEPREFTVKTGMILKGFQEPFAVGVDSRGDVYVGDIGNNTVSVYLPNSSTAFVTFPTQNPMSIAVNPSNIAYVASNDGPSGQIVTTAYELPQYVLDLTNNPAAITHGIPENSVRLGTAPLLYQQVNGTSYSAATINNDGFYLAATLGTRSELVIARDANVFNPTALSVFPLDTGLNLLFAATADRHHNIFLSAPLNGGVYYFKQPLANSFVNLFSPHANGKPLKPGGLAFDKVRNRLYVSYPDAGYVRAYSISYVGDTPTATPLPSLIQ